MAAAKFEIVRKANGSIKKLHGRISQKKELNVTVLNNQAYLHISDMKFAFKDSGKFNKNHVKQVSLTMDEVNTLKHYLLNMDAQVQEFLVETETEQTVQQKLEEMQQQQLLQQDQQPPAIPKSESTDSGFHQQLQQQLQQQQLLQQEHQPSAIPKSEHADMGAHQQMQQQPQADSQQEQPQRQQERSMFPWAPYQHLAAQQQRYQPCWNVQQQPQQQMWNEQQQHQLRQQPCWNAYQQQPQQPWNEQKQQQPPQQQQIPVVGNGTPWVTGTRQQWDKPDQSWSGDLEQYSY